METTGTVPLPVLIADPSQRSRARLGRILTHAGVPSRTADAPEDVLPGLLASGAGCMLVEPGFFGQDALEKLAGLSKHGIPVLTFCDPDDAEGALDAIRRGSFDVLVRPASAQVLVERVTIALRAEAARRAREALVAPARARL